MIQIMIHILRFNINVRIFPFPYIYIYIIRYMCYVPIKMTKKLFFIRLFTCLFSACLTASRHRRDINWNDNNWAMSCDFFNNDFANIQTTAELCGPTCENTPECTHFTWTEWNDGTCWMKQGAITKDDAFPTNDPTMVCGILNRDETTR